MNVSLICACKNRTNALKVSLSSWLFFDEIKEIIIVDWNSDEPINYLTKLDPRIKIIRVEDQKYFNQPQPLNLALSLAKEDYVVKVDTDYILNPYFNFFKSYQIDDNSFVSGQHNFASPEYVDQETGLSMFDRTKMTVEELNEYFNSYSHYFKYLTGFLFTKKENFLAVGGYNETLTKYYAFEDDEMCKRLELYGLEHKKINYDYHLIHLPHPDSKRLENFKGFNQSNFKELVENLPEGEQKWQTEYYISQVHIHNNKMMCQKIKDYYYHSITEWNVQKIDDQNFFAEMIPNKKLDGITSVYYVSLEESQNRRDNLECQFEHYGIDPIGIISKRFSECDDVVTGKYADTLNEGTKGCVISHLCAIKHWYENTNEDYGFFCEDDLSLETVNYWDFTWEEFIEKIPEDAECIQLLTIRKDFDTFELRERLWDDWGATAYIITREYAKKLIYTYVRDKSFHLEIPGSDIMPLIENILFASVGKSYTCPLFVEETKFESTFVGNDDDVNDGQKNNHYIANEKVLNFWKSKNENSVKKVVKKSTPKLVDCFTYFNSKELLELRVNLLKDYVDKFVIAEANYTQSGIPKEYTLKNTIKELNLPEDIIEVIEVDLSEENLGPITDYERIFDTNPKHASRERVQRDAIAKCLETNNFDKNTVFIVSDIDEIINPKYISMMCDLARSHRDKIFKADLVYLEGRADLRCYYRDSDQPKDWSGALYFCLKEHMQKVNLSYIRSSVFVPYEIVWAYTEPRTENGVFIPGERMKDLGWHFTWMGTNEDRFIKSQSVCHFDKDIDELLYKNFSKEKNKWKEFFLNYDMGNEDICPSGVVTYTTKPYPVENLPSVIFDLPRVKKYLLPEYNSEDEHTKTDLEELLITYSLDTENPENNFNLGVWYENNGHTAPALSYFLRCAERAEDKDLAYEALIRSSYCYDKQGTRDGSAKSLLEQALCLCPKRPEAYYLMSRFAERRQWWQDCYIYADQGLMYADFDSKPLKTDVEYPGKYGFLFEKSIASWWWGKVDEARELILDIKNNYELSENHIDLLNNNLKVMGVE